MNKVSIRRLELAERTFSDKLVFALRRCANGHWGLFGQNDAAIGRMGKHQAPQLNAPDIQELLDLGEDITRMRSKLGISENFPPYERLMRTRSMRGGNVPGEPKLARQWLESM